MNNPACLTRYIQQVAGVTNNIASDAIEAFVPTFSALLGTTDEDIEKFVSTTHSANSGRATADRVVIPASAISALQTMLFELKDRQRCDALPDEAVFNNLTAAHLLVLKQQRALAKEHAKGRKEATLPDMSVPTFKGTNYDEFITAFTTLVSRQTGVNDLPLDYLMRENETGLYDAVYSSREEKLKHCVTLQGDNFRTDSQMLYSLFVQHIGTTGVGSSVVNKHKTSKNGYQCYKEFKAHFANETYKQNIATVAENTMTNAVYNGPRKNFSIETYYTIMTKAFNDLATAGPSHQLNEEQKITKFESGIKEEKAIGFAITAKSQWDALPRAERTFDKYYNLFSSKLNKQLTMSHTHSYNTRSNAASIHAVDSSSLPSRSSTGRGGRGRGRGRFGRGRTGRGRGSYGRGSAGRVNGGRGNTSRSYHPYMHANPLVPTYNNFVPEAKVYSEHIFNNFTPSQKREVSQLKTANGWLNANTPPPGFVIDQSSGFPVPSQTTLAAMNSSVMIANANMQHTPALPPPPMINVPPPPPPYNGSMSIGPSRASTPTRAGENFGRSGSRTSNVSVNAVSINGQPYSGQVYDKYGNPLN